MLHSSQKPSKFSQIRKKIKVTKYFFDKVIGSKGISSKMRTTTVVKSTTVVVGSDTETLGCYGLTMPFRVDHDSHELIIAVVNLPQLLLDR